MNRLFPRIAVAALLVTSIVAKAQKPSDDPVLKAMQAELDREKAQLVLPGMQRPYFIEYRLDDFSSYEAVATYGALTREEEGRQRIVRVTVRIGDYTFD
ncbi:MAG TPA: peptidase U62, partial [Edaphobacter sp.]